MKIRTVPIRGFLAPKLHWLLPKIGRMCCIPEKTAKKNAQTLLQTLSLYATIVTDIARPAQILDLGTTLIEGYLHGDVPIKLSQLKRWLPMNHSELPKLLEITFKAGF